MEIQQTPANIKDGFQLKFIPDLSSTHYDFFEVDPALADQLTQTQISIKSYQIDKLKTAALCTNDNTYKMKRNETSNSILVVGLETGTIYKQTNLHIEIEKAQTNKYQLAKLIIEYPLINLDPQTDQYFMIDGIDKSQIIATIQMSEGEFEKIIRGQEIFEFYMIETKFNCFAFFDPMLLYELIDQLLIFLANFNSKSFTVEDIMMNNDGIINQKFMMSSTIIKYALNFICNQDPDSPEQYSLSADKVQKSIALAMLYVKGDYFLNEFITALKHAIELALPFDAEANMQYSPSDQNESSLKDANKEQSTQQNFDNNLFEGYKVYDLSMLKGQAVLIPANELKVINKTDDVIRLLNPYYSIEFEFSYGMAEKRLEAMYTVKDKWTKPELEQYVKPFVDTNVNFDNYLMKNTRVLQEKNPFDNSKEVTYYLKKF